MHRGDITDQQWQRFAPLLPKRKTTGRPPSDDRRNVHGIRWILRTGAPWRDWPERYGGWQTVASRFDRWQQVGVWDNLFAAVQRQADGLGQLNWQVHYVDSSVIRAQQHAAGSKKRIRPLKR